MGRIAKAVFAGATGALACMGLSGCLVLNYSSESGWWVWPGSFVITLALALIWWLGRRH